MVSDAEVERAKNVFRTSMFMNLDGSTAVCEDIGRYRYCACLYQKLRVTVKHLPITTIHMCCLFDHLSNEFMYTCIVCDCNLTKSESIVIFSGVVLLCFWVQYSVLYLQHFEIARTPFYIHV